MATRWKITKERVGGLIVFFAWWFIFIAGLHVLEFIIASFLMIWSLTIIHYPELQDKVAVLLHYQIIWIFLFIGGLLLSRLRKKRKKCH